jgi:hypothetical protein
VNKCIALDWVQLLSYGQVCLNKHGVLPTHKIWKNHAMKTALTCKEIIESSLEVPQKSRSFRKHKYGTNTTIRIAKNINKKTKNYLTTNKLSCSNLGARATCQIVDISDAYLGGINTLHAKLSKCEAMWSVTFKVCYTYIHIPYI